MPEKAPSRRGRASAMKPSPSGLVDGGRQRCDSCGHPRKEHITQIGCSVPKCPCAEYMQLSVETATPAPAHS
jgi:hypothetical protein